MSTYKNEGDDLPQILEDIVGKQNLNPTTIAAQKLKYELMIKLTLRNVNLPYGLRLRCLIYYLILQNELKKKTEHFSQNERITYLRNLENIEFATITGTLLNKSERQYYFSVLEKLKIPKLHGKLLLWFGTIQPKKEQVNFGFFDLISPILLALPFLASVGCLISLSFCDCIKIESKFTYATLFTLLSILTFANLKSRGYESYKIGAKYFSATSKRR